MASVLSGTIKEEEPEFETRFQGSKPPVSVAEGWFITYLSHTLRAIGICPTPSATKINSRTEKQTPKQTKL